MNNCHWCGASNKWINLRCHACSMPMNDEAYLYDTELDAADALAEREADARREM